MDKFIIVSSDLCNQKFNKANVCNVIPGPPLLVSRESRVALIDISIPLVEDMTDIKKNQCVLIFPVDQTQNELITFGTSRSVDELNTTIGNIMSRKFSSQLRAPSLKLIMRDMTQYWFNYDLPAPGFKEMWFERGIEMDHNTYQPPHLYYDKFEKIVYQIPGFHTGNIPVFINLCESFFNRPFRYGGMVLTPEENTQRLRNFSRWRFCRKELGSSFPIQIVSKPLIKVECNNPLKHDMVYKIPAMTSEEQYDAEIVRKTKEIEITCNLVDSSSKILDTLVVTPEVISESFGQYQRFNTRILSPKFHRLSCDNVKEIKLCVKDRSKNEELKFPSGSVVATLLITHVNK